MKTPLTFFVLVGIVALSGCNLSEADRMDLSRKEVIGISCEIDNFRFMDSDSIPLSKLLGLQPYHSFAPFQANIVDHGTEECGSWTFKAIYENDTVFSYQLEQAYGNGWFSGIPMNAPWFDHLDQVHFTVSSRGTNANQPASNLRIYDDRPLLVAALVNDTSKIKLGDTIRISLRNNSTKDSIVVSSDYVGMRMLDDYVLSLHPGQDATLRWLVVTNSALPIWIDLGWGDFGQSRRFVFKIR